MSTTPDIGAYLDGAKQYHLVLNTLNIIALTVLLFDHLLTFADEVEYIWNKRLTPFNMLFLTNRYLASITMICYVVGEFLPYDIQERIYPKFQPGMISAVQTASTVIIAEAILIIRVYAVYQRSKPILALLILVWVAHIAVGCSVLNAHVTRVVDLVTISYAFNLRLGLSFFLPALLFDAIVAGFLTIGLYKKLRFSISHMPLARLIIQDGLLYFFAVFGSNVLWMVTGFLLCNSEPRSLGFAPMYTLSSATTTTMIGRLTLSLKGYETVGDNLPITSMNLQFLRSNPLLDTSVSPREGE